MDIRKKLEIFMAYEKGEAFLDIATNHKVTVKQAADACSDVQSARISSKEKVKVVYRKHVVKKSKVRHDKLVKMMNTLR